MRKGLRPFLNLCLSVVCITLWSGLASAQVKFNEFMVNPPGSDNGKEFVELISDTPNYSLNDVVMIVIEGDTFSGANPINPRIAGTVDQIIPFTGQQTGSNRLFLQRDSATVLSPAPEAATSVLVRDFSPDIENGAQTYLLVKLRAGSTLTVGTNLDPDNDGVLDVSDFEVVYDAIGVTSEQADVPTGQLYAAQFGGKTFRNDVFTPDAYVRLPNGKGIVSDVLIAPNGTDATGPWILDNVSFNPNSPFLAGEAINESGFILISGQMTPGRANPLFTHEEVKGTLALDQRPTFSGTVTFLFRAQDGSVPNFTRTATPAADGTFTLTNIPTAPFDVFIKRPFYLQKRVDFDAAGGDTSKLDGTLLPGDLIDDEIIDLFDLIEFFGAYGASPSDSNWNVNADFNADNIIDLFDLIIFFGNYGASGDVP
jgi:hypothetical protein